MCFDEDEDLTRGDNEEPRDYDEVEERDEYDDEVSDKEIDAEYLEYKKQKLEKRPFT